MTTKPRYPIPSDLAGADSPSGWSVAAIDNDQIIVVHEFRNISPQVAHHLPIDADMAAAIISRWLDTVPAGKIVKELGRVGRVAIGMAYQGVFHEV